MTFPAELHRGADGYTMMRLETYDLSVEQWRKGVGSATGRRAEIARSEGGRGRVYTDVQVWPDGSMYFYTRYRLLPSIEFTSAAEALAYHELLAKDITERIETMEQHEVSALMDGAL